MTVDKTMAKTVADQNREERLIRIGQKLLELYFRGEKLSTVLCHVLGPDAYDSALENLEKAITKAIDRKVGQDVP
jgi:hypothetical protein